MAERERGKHEGGKEADREAASLLTSYYLDESDPDLVILRRQDGTFVAAFSARGATREGIVGAAREDYEALRARQTGDGKRPSREGEVGDDPTSDVPSR